VSYFEQSEVTLNFNIHVSFQLTNTPYARIDERIHSLWFSVPAQCFSVLFVGLYYTECHREVTELHRDKTFAQGDLLTLKPFKTKFSN